MHLRGMNPTDIARRTETTRANVLTAIEDFRLVLKREASSAVDLRDRMMDILFESDEAFRMVIDEAWKTSEAADSAGDYRTKVAALKLVESSTKTRAELIQKAGVGQDQEIIDQINDTEERQQVLIQLLKDIRDEFPEVAEIIATRLSRIQTEVIEIGIIDGDL